MLLIDHSCQNIKQTLVELKTMKARSSKSFILAALIVTLFISSAASLNAALVFEKTKDKIVAALASCAASESGPIVALLVDPLDVTAFGMQIKFNDSRYTFDSIEYLNGYVQTDPFTLNGGILHVFGAFPGPTPPAGEVNLFEVFFTDSTPGKPLRGLVVGGGDSYLDALNTDTGSITRVHCHVCPNSVGDNGATALLLAAALGSLLAFRRIPIRAV